MYKSNVNLSKLGTKPSLAKGLDLENCMNIANQSFWYMEELRSIKSFTAEFFSFQEM